MEALEELIEKVRVVRAVEELKPLVASIAPHRAVSRLRQPPSSGDFAKIIYDPAAAEVRVSGRAQGKNFATTIPVEKNLAGALDEAAHFARDQFGR